ncbi:MAG: insulinase family protein [Flavobacterium sp.]|nr:MAG: insulinase family protein [Flavobacterium sp.]
MKYKFTLGLLLILSQLAISQNVLPYPITQKKLANGLNVVTVPYDSPGLAAFYIVVRAGSRDEIEKGKSGFAHFFEHMMFRGTDKYPTDKYEDIITSLGAAANANTWIDRTVYHMTGNAEKLETMFDIESDRFQNLKYSLPDFKTEAGAVKGEYTKNSASPYTQLEEKIAETAFTKHTYSHTTMGYFADIVDMPNQYEYSLEFFKRFYRPEYTTIIVVGDVTPERVEALSQKYFGNWKHGDYVSTITAEPAQNETRYTHIQKANFPPALSLNYKGPAFTDSNIECAALDILNEIVFSEKSPLYKKLVLDEQKVRSLSGSYTFTRDPYLISIDASVVDAADMQYVKDEIAKALEASKTKTFDAKLLEETKTRLKYGFAMRTDTPTNIAESLSYFTWLTGNPESVNKLYAMYDKVTADDLMRVAAKYYKNTGLTIATISPAATIDVK